MWSKDLLKHEKVERDEDVGRGKTRGRTHVLKNLIVFLSFCLIVFSLTLSGIIDFFAVANDQKMTVVDMPRSDTMLWIAQETPKDAIFLNTSYLYNPASIAGRSIFLGWPYFAWSAGYKENRMPIKKEIYESKDPAIFCPLLAKYNISYVTVEDVAGNQDDPTIELTYFRSITTPIFSNTNNTFDIYSTQSLCPSL